MAHRKSRFIVTALFALAAGAASAADEPKPPHAADETTRPSLSEPTKCYRAVLKLYEGKPGSAIGLAIRVCGGTTDAEATIACYVEAVGSEESGGLGLDIGAAIDLCSPAGARLRQ